MKIQMFIAATTAVAFSLAASPAPAAAPKSKGILYAYHTGPAEGGCPGLDWHILREPDNHLTGFVAWDHMKHMAKVEGMHNKDGTFELQGQMIGGASGPVTIKGTTGGDYINITIDGSGTKCDGDTLSVPRVTGGTDGGG